MQKFTTLPRYVILHSSDTEDGPALDTRAIRRYHMSVNGWDDIGYHWVIERSAPQNQRKKQDSEIKIVAGRSPRFQGAHCRAAGRNRDSIGICVVGKFDDVAPDYELWLTSARLAATLATVYGIPAENCRGHREYERKKTCPGREWDLDAWRAEVQRLMADPNALLRGIIAGGGP